MKTANSSKTRSGYLGCLDYNVKPLKKRMPRSSFDKCKEYSRAKAVDAQSVRVLTVNLQHRSWR
jgi:hypothetical protein